MSNFIKCNSYHTHCVSKHKLKTSFETHDFSYNGKIVFSKYDFTNCVYDCM